MCLILENLKSNTETLLGIRLPALSKTITWTFGFVFLAGLTMNDFWILFTDYRDNNIATHVEVIIIDENFRPPQPVILVPIYKIENRESEALMQIARHLHNGTEGQCQMCHDLANDSWDVWNDENITEFLSRDLDTYYHALSMAFVRRLYTKMETDPEIDKNLFEGPVSSLDGLLFSAAVNFFIWQSNSDYYLQPLYLPSGISSLHATVVPTNMTLQDTLFSRVLSGLCREINFVEFSLTNEFDFGQITNKTCESLLLDSAAPVVVDTNGLWVALPPSDGPQIKEYTFTFKHQLVWNDSLWTPDPGVLDKIFSVYPDAGVQYVAAIDSLYSSYVYQGTIAKDKRGKNITVRYSVHLRAKETRLSKSKCYNGSSATMCFTKCTKEYIIEKCGCVPFSSSIGLVYPDHLAYCNLEHYEACNISELPVAERKFCMDKCKAACEYTSYSWQIDQDSYQPDKRGVTELFLRILPTFNTFPQFSWRIKNSPEQFLSQIGGIVNFYLGFSGLSLIAFLFMCVDVLKRLKKKLWKNGDQASHTMAMIEKPLSYIHQDRMLSELWHGHMKADIKTELELLRIELKMEMQKIKKDLKTELQAEMKK